MAMNYIHALDVANKRVKAINCDENGNLQVDIVSSSAGGDATAANQLTNHTKLDTVATKLDTIDGSVNTIEACVASNELAVSHSALTELAAALNSSKLDVNISSDNASLATSANQVTANGHLSDIKTTHYADGDAVGAADKGQLVLGKDNSGNAHPVRITSNGDVEVEIAEMPRGQQTASQSLPVVLASDNKVNTTDRNLATVASGASISSGSNTGELDMDGYRHVRIYGSSTTNFGSFCLVNRASSGGSDFLDGSNIFSASDPTGGSTYHFSAVFENTSRYIAFRNLDAGAQVVTLYAERIR